MHAVYRTDRFTECTDNSNPFPSSFHFSDGGGIHLRGCEAIEQRWHQGNFRRTDSLEIRETHIPVELRSFRQILHLSESRLSRGEHRKQLERVSVLGCRQIHQVPDVPAVVAQGAVRPVALPLLLSGERSVRFAEGTVRANGETRHSRHSKQRKQQHPKTGPQFRRVR